MKRLVAVLVSFFFLSAASAEMRIWSDKKGNTVEAEYISIIGGKVVLKTPEGKPLKVPMSGLSKVDRDYIASKIPPKMSIEVDLDKDRDTLSSYSSSYGSYGYEHKSETVKCSVIITKTSREPCTQEFTAHVYVIGKSEKSDRREVLTYTKQEFDFKTEKSVEVNTKPASSEYVKSSYYRDSGTRYDGYIAMVENADGEIVLLESSQSSYEKHAAKIRKAKKGTRFDRDFDVLDD